MMGESASISTRSTDFHRAPEQRRLIRVIDTNRFRHVGIERLHKQPCSLVRRTRR